VNIEGNLSGADCAISRRLAAREALDLPTGLAPEGRYQRQVRYRPTALVRADAVALVTFTESGRARADWSTLRHTSAIYVHGDGLSPDTRAWLAEHSPDATVGISAQSHWVHEEQPQLVAAVINRTEHHASA